MAVVNIEKSEKTVYRVRVGPDGWKFGDPFDLHFVVMGDPPEGEAGGLDKPISVSQWRAVREALVGMGYKVIWIERRRGGKIIYKKVVNKA